MAYVNPFSGISNLVPERVDQGVDFAGSGPITAIGNGIVKTVADNPSSSGWPGLGGYVSYQLTDGPAAGDIVYVAEDIKPTVQAGEQIQAGQQIAQMYNSGTGIEIGWASGNGTAALSSTPAGGGISAAGPFPTNLGLNFDQLLISLGVKEAPNYNSKGYGNIPSGIPSWTNNSPGSSSYNPAGWNPLGNAGNVGGDLIQGLLSAFGLGSAKDLAERAGLIMFGGVLVLIGIWLTFSGGQKTTITTVNSKTGEKTKTVEKGGKKEEGTTPEIAGGESGTAAEGEEAAVAV